ncbi:MAG TPA: helix-turn-helix transcriptional regulator [Terriglobales bacterium]|nr:helix-turn-helix transcriptional regulator [Terriglobales bacterium]
MALTSNRIGKIGERIRDFRLQRGLSQGDIEQRTGLLRCYLSRVENGHTTPSLQTLNKIARALEMPLANFFAEPAGSGDGALPTLTDEAVTFLTQVRRYASALNDADRQAILAMIKRMAYMETPHT